MSTLLVWKKDASFLEPLLTTMNLYEHEVLMLFPGNLYSEMKAHQPVPVAIAKAVAARMDEIMKWVERGHTFIVLGLRPSAYHIVEKNQFSQVAIEQLSPFNKIKLTAKSGQNIRCSPAVAPLLDTFIGTLSYDYVLQGANLIPLMYARTTQKTVGPPDIVWHVPSS
jgi:hypothetical protein